VIFCPEETVEEDVVIEDCESEIAPGTTVIVGAGPFVTGDALMAVIVVAVPERIPVKVAV
jgi:hypothetical protein